mgnify:CR=1 FL=1
MTDDKVRDRIADISRRAARMHRRDYVPISERAPIEYRQAPPEDFKSRAAGDTPEPDLEPEPPGLFDDELPF